MKLRNAYDVVFASDSNRFFAVGRSVFGWKVERGPRKLRLERIWRTLPFSHVSQLCVSPTDRIVVVKNTSGRLAALSSSTGESVWLTGELGEGPAPIFVDERRLINASSKGSLQLIDAESGSILQTTNVAKAFNLSADRKRQTFLVSQSQLPPASNQPPPPTQVCRIDPSTLQLTALDYQRDRLTAALSPSGEKFVALHGSPTSSQIDIVDMRSGSVLASREFSKEPPKPILPAWTQDSEAVCVTGWDAHHIFTMPSLEEVIWPGLYPSGASFSSDGRWCALSRWSETDLMEVGDALR